MKTILVVLLLTGCAGPTFTRGSATEEQFAKDTAECEYEAKKISVAAPSNVEGAFQSTLRYCMRARGYVEGK